MTGFSPEVTERAMRMVMEGSSEYESQWAARRLRPRSAARPGRCDVGCTSKSATPASVRGARAPSRNASRRLNEKCVSCARLTKFCVWSALFSPKRARPPLQAVIAFIEQHRATYGAEPICNAPQVAPSGYWRHAARRFAPPLSTRTCRVRWIGSTGSSKPLARISCGSAISRMSRLGKVSCTSPL